MKSNIIKSFGIFLLSVLVLSACRNKDNKIEPTCWDEVRNQGELRVDCGGPNCAECPPSCEDKLQNQDEQSPETVNNPVIMGIDCGGEDCADIPCSTCEDGIQNAHWVYNVNLVYDDYLQYDTVAQDAGGRFYSLVMESGIDCGFPCTNFCEPGTQCEDGIQNGDEEGIDCGGTCTNPCPPPSCTDGIQNGTETGVDCGDSIEPSVCGECPDPSCTDGIQNIHIEYNEDFVNGYIVVVETGIDCDGNPFTSCPDCPIFTCFDGVQNGTETGIDCGGSCLPTLCDDTPNCNNGVMDGSETGIDCDMDPATACPPCAVCGPEGSGIDGIKNGPEYEVDCVDYAIPEYPCPVCPSCHDEVLNSVHNVGDLSNMYELDVDCGTPDCGPCDQEVVVELIGLDGSQSPFRDQYSYNRILAEAGHDTLGLGNQYPGLKIEKVVGGFQGPPHLIITANQGIMTANDGIYLRTVTIYMPYPESMAPTNPYENVPGVSVPMVNPLAGIIPGSCNAPITNLEVPFIMYRETLLSNPSVIDNCYFSFNLEPPLDNSDLSVNYLRGYLESEYYAKGGIDMGNMISIQLIGDDLLGSFAGLSFKIQYPFIP